MILLFTDFGSNGPYVGQMTASIRKAGYSGDVIPVFSDLPAFGVKASAVLLKSYMRDFPENSVFPCVVDPGVGSSRKAVVIKSQGRWFVGPDNGLFELILREDVQAEIFEIIWQPKELSASFHGRDLFAPVAAKLATGKGMEMLKSISADSLHRQDWPDDIAEVVYIDRYGNAMTGVSSVPSIRSIKIGGHRLPIKLTFSSVAVGAPLAYENANGLIEIAVNQGRADQYFDLTIGTPVEIL